MRCWSLARNLFHPQFHFLEFFLYIRNTSFQEHLRVFRIHFFYWNVSSKNLFFISLFLQKIRRPVLVSYKLVTFNNKFTIIEFAPFSLVTKGSFVTFGKICLSVKGHSFIFSLIPCCSFSSKNWTHNSFDICACRCDLFCRFALLKFLLSFIFVNVISVLQLIFQNIYTYWNENMTAWFIYFLFTILHKYTIVQNFK